MAEPMVHHRGADFRSSTSVRSRRLQEVFRTQCQVLLFTASGTGAMDSAVANLCRRRRPGRGRHRRRVRRALGRDLRAVRARRPAHRLRVGRGARARTRSVPRSPRAARARLLHPLRDLDRRRLRRAGPESRGRRRDARRRCDLLARRGAARDGRVGYRRRRLRLAEGAHVPARASRWRASPSRSGTVCRRRAASTSTGADAQGAGGIRRRVHARRVADPGPRRRTRDAARRGSRRGVRAPHRGSAAPLARG